MAIKLSESRFPSIKQDFDIILNKNKRFKALTKRIQSKSGRSYGLIVSPRRDSYCKRLYRFIDFKRLNFSETYALVLRNSYDPMRNAPTCIICFPVGIFSMILLPQNLNEGELIRNYTDTPSNIGDSSSLRNFKDGTLLHNLSYAPKSIGQIARSAGSFTMLIHTKNEKTLLRLRTGELRKFTPEATATKGVVSGQDYFLRDHLKAGNMRYLGVKPRTRPSAMNPVDHPMGGRTRGGFQPTNPKGIITLNRPTKKYYHPGIIYTKRQKKFQSI